MRGVAGLSTSVWNENHERLSVCARCSHRRVPRPLSLVLVAPALSAECTTAFSRCIASQGNSTSIHSCLQSRGLENCRVFYVLKFPDKVAPSQPCSRRVCAARLHPRTPFCFCFVALLRPFAPAAVRFTFEKGYLTLTKVHMTSANARLQSPPNILPTWQMAPSKTFTKGSTNTHHHQKERGQLPTITTNGRKSNLLSPTRAQGPPKGTKPTASKREP